MFCFHCSRSHVEKKLEAQSGLVEDYLKGTMFLISDKKCGQCGFINTEFRLN